MQLVAYNPAWPQEFEQARSLILQAAEGWVVAVEHVGSTAVPGLSARPIIDLLAGVERMADAEHAVSLLEGLSYLDQPRHGAEPAEQRFLCRPRHGPATHHVYLAAIGGASWRRHLLVRDWLRTHSVDAERYARLKAQLMGRFADDPDGYTAAKTPFIRHIEDQAAAAARQED